MKKETTLQKRLLILVTTLLLSQVALAYVATSRAKHLFARLEGVTRRELPSTRLLTLADMLHDGIRAVVMDGLYRRAIGETGKLASVVKEAQEKQQTMLDVFKELEALPLSEESVHSIEEVKPLVTTYVESAVRVLRTASSGEEGLLKGRLNDYVSQFEALEEKLAELGKKIEDDARSQGDDGRNIVSLVIAWSVAGVILSLIMAYVVLQWTRGTFVRLAMNIGTNTRETTKATNTLVANATSVSESSVEQSAAIQETVSALSEMSSMIAQTSENIRTALQTAKDAQEKSSEGQQIMERLANSMKLIQGANEDLQGIARVIANISSKTEIINDIVFKTQILSFNASIEAARAGQHGKGFAVVAEEVGNLAELSGTAARDIEALLEESTRKVGTTLESITTRVGDGLRTSNHALGAFRAISEQVAEVNAQMNAINEATEQQELGISQANSAMKQMETTSQNNARAAAHVLDMANRTHQELGGLERNLDVLSEMLNVENANTAPGLAEPRRPASDQAPAAESAPSAAEPLRALAQSLLREKTAGAAAASLPVPSDEITADDPSFKKMTA